MTLECDLLIRHVNVLQHTDQGFYILENGFIAIRGTSIVEVGMLGKLPCPVTARATINGAGKLAIPGLINAHTHAAMTLFRGLADDLPLKIWLEKHIFPAESRYVTPEMTYWCAKLAAAEMLLSGTTTVADGYFFESQGAKAFADAGIRAVAAHGVIDFPAPGVPDSNKNIETVQSFLEEWSEKNDRITPAIFCHSPYACSPETLTSAKSLADQKGALFFIHLGETKWENDSILEKYKETPASHLRRLGVLDRNTVCVHCVWLEEGDIDILLQSGASVCACPQSNMKLASGIAPVPRLLEAGIPLALGTDGCASNNTLDMFAEMKALALLQKVATLDPAIMPARDVLCAATIGGAKSLGMDQVIGGIEKGKAADIVLIDLDSPSLTPFYGADTLVYAGKGSHVSSVFVAGKEIVRQGRILSFDLEETLAHVRALAMQVAKDI